MSREYETPDDYAGTDHDDQEAHDAWADRNRDYDREEMALRRWEERREAGPDDDAPEPEETLADHYAWLRREEYGDQDPPDTEAAA
jgi:hypothetical protein